jgi:hypothetical protein
MNALRRRSRNAPNKESLLNANDVIRAHTAGFNEGLGLAIDFDRLGENEQTRLVGLVDKAGKGRSWGWGRLSAKERRELEALIEKGADARGVFEGARSFEEIRALAAQAHTERVRRPLTRKQETSIFAELGRCIEQGWLEAPHVALISLLLIAFSGGRPLGPRSRIEALDGGETVLVVDTQFGPFSADLDPEQQLAPRWTQTVDHLAANEWLDVRKNGVEWWISPGGRLRAAMAGKPVRDVVAA